MKNKLILFAFLMFFMGVESQAHQAKTTYAEIEFFKGVEDFLADFKKAVLKKKAEDVLTFFDLTYKTEQHDNFLGGRTEQFLNEFFRGQRLGGKGFANIQFADIKDLECLEVNVKDEDFCEVSYLVITKKEKVQCSWSVTQRKDMGKTIFGLVGAVG